MAPARPGSLGRHLAHEWPSEAQIGPFAAKSIQCITTRKFAFLPVFGRVFPSSSRVSPRLFPCLIAVNCGQRVKIDIAQFAACPILSTSAPGRCILVAQTCHSSLFVHYSRIFPPFCLWSSSPNERALQIQQAHRCATNLCVPAASINRDGDGLPISSTFPEK